MINYATASTSVIRISREATGNGARKNTIRNVNIVGGDPTTNTVHGIMVGAASTLTTGAGGNDSLKDDERESSNCEVRTAINPPMTSETSEELKHEK